jgi:hypothetical protein
MIVPSACVWHTKTIAKIRPLGNARAALRIITLVRSLSSFVVSDRSMPAIEKHSPSRGTESDNNYDLFLS